MYFDDFSFDNDMNFFVGKIVDINEDGYIYGNMFKSEYKPYKDYNVYRLNPKNEKEMLLLKIMEETFIITDLNLYLDVHPEDNDVYKYFQKHERKLNNYISEYQKNYGSIYLNGEKENYDWINGPWPWEVSK